jgi:hypothetical protein
MLASLEEFEVVALRDWFDPKIEDYDFLPRLREKGFVYVTADDRQKTREREARAIREAGITALWLGPFWDRLDFWGQAKWIINRWQMVDGYVQGVATGTCAEVKQNGKSRPFTL